MATTMNRDTSTSVLSYVQTGLIAAVIAAVVNLVVYFVGQAMGVPYEIIMQPGTPLTPLQIPQILVMSILPGVVAALLAWALNRYLARGNTIFVGIAVLILLLSLVPLVTMAETVTTTTRIALAIMHVATAAIITYMLSRKAA